MISEETGFAGKTVAVTGATSGIGLASAVALAAQGARVIGVGRQASRCTATEQEIMRACPDAQICYLVADLSLLSQVHRLAGGVRNLLEAWQAPGLDVLVNNAGIYSSSYVKTPDGLELTQAVNHFAPFLLTHELLPLLAKPPFSRVITVSSGSHYNTQVGLERFNHPRFYFGLWAYKVSKLANVLFTLEFNRRFSNTTVRAFAIDPGLVNTRIGEKGTGGFASLVWRLRKRSGELPEKPAKTILYLSREPSLQEVTDFYWYDLHPRETSRQAQDPCTAQALWDLSCQLCHIQEFGRPEP